MLLHARFSEINGLENTSTLVKFSTHTKSNFIQILHDGKDHWLTVAGSESNEIRCFDSMKKSSFPHSVLRQIAQLMHTSERQIRIITSPVQQQTNGYDCGLYAIAFATELAFGFNPEEASFNQSEMRSHLLNCYKNQTMDRFPRMKSRVSRCKKTMQLVEVYCLCRDVFFSNDVDKDRGNFMAMCSFCGDWFHKKCLNIPLKVFKDDREAKKWKCSSCF